MAHLKILKHAQSHIPVSVYQRGLERGKEDYTLVVGGRTYIEEFTRQPRLLVTGLYAPSFGEFYDQFKEVLNKFPRSPFKIKTIRFLKGSLDVVRKENILKLVSEHNAPFLDLEKKVNAT